MMGRVRVWSYGGGTQSVAIAVLLSKGEIEPVERVVIADTGREASETWEYTEQHVTPLLTKVGLSVEVAPHSLSKVDLYAKNGNLLIPAYTRQSRKTGRPGQMRAMCSNEWKRRVIQRYLRKQGYGPKNPITLLIGISTDEAHRVKPSDVEWMAHDYPLLYERPTDRMECVKIVTDAGLPTPPKSCCWMCPYRGKQQWRDLHKNYPSDWAQAVALDKEIRKVDPAVFVHRAGVPLEDALDHKVPDPQLDLCDSGFCFI
jgi:hypothetical protein